MVEFVEFPVTVVLADTSVVFAMVLLLVVKVEFLPEDEESESLVLVVDDDEDELDPLLLSLDEPLDDDELSLPENELDLSRREPDDELSEPEEEELSEEEEPLEEDLSDEELPEPEELLPDESLDADPAPYPYGLTSLRTLLDPLLAPWVASSSSSPRTDAVLSAKDIFRMRFVRSIV